MDLLPDWAPNAHPLILHFPIALLTVAAGFDLIGLISKDRGTWRKAADWLYVIGAVAALATWYTGREAADSVFLPTAANGLLTEHADLGAWTMYFFGGYGLLRLGLSFTKLSTKTLPRVAFFLLGAAGVGLMTVTATHGAELVYRYGVGVEAVETMPSAPVAAKTDSETGIGAAPDGWTWLPARASAWKNQATWLEGSAASLSSSLVDGGDMGDVFELSVSEPTLFTLPGAIDRLQVDLTIDVSSFDGTVQVVHHAQPSGDYAFTSFGSGTIRLGKTENSDQLIQATESFTSDSWSEIRVVSDGTHFRSYVDQELVIHGHGAAFEPGQVGLRLNGTGTVRLAMMQAVDLAGSMEEAAMDMTDAEMDMQEMPEQGDDHEHEDEASDSGISDPVVADSVKAD